MKTFADVKRRAQPGAVLKITFHANPRLQDAVGRVKTVKLAQTNRIALLENGKEDRHSNYSWLTWRGAASVRITGPDSFDFYYENDRLLGFEFLKE